MLDHGALALQRSLLALGHHSRYRIGIADMNHKSLLLLILTAFASQHALADGTRISPKWIKDNPGRLSLISGSGFAGHTDYLAYITTDHEAIYEVWTKIQFITEDKQITPWITSTTRAGAPAKSIRFGETSYGIYAPTAPGGGLKAHIIYEVYECKVKTDADGKEEWSRVRAYTLDKSDWMSLEIAAAEEKR